jgi:hypothetical protein
MEWTLVFQLTSNESTQAIEIRRSPKGDLFRYYVMRWWNACEEDEGALGDGYWSNTEMSGCFASQEECEKDAICNHSWLHTE